MKECANQVRIASLVAIVTAFIPFTPPSYAQSANIDGSYISGVANSCSSNMDGTFTPDVWNCIAGAVSLTLFSQTGRAQPTLDGPYIRILGDYCSLNTEGSFKPDVWDCMAQSIINDIPYRQGVAQYCTYTYGLNTLNSGECVNRFRAIKQDCYSDPQFYAQPENSDYCQAPSLAIARTLYPQGPSWAGRYIAGDPAYQFRMRNVRDVRNDRYLTSRCTRLADSAPIQYQKATACQSLGRQPQPTSQPQPFIPPPLP